MPIVPPTPSSANSTSNNRNSLPRPSWLSRLALSRLAQTACISLVLVGIAVASLAPANTKAASTDEEYFELMKLFVDSFEQIDRNYVTPVDKRELLEAAMRGMLGKLDPYSNYIPNEELNQFNQQVEQEFGGIGIQVTFEPRTRQLMVMTPLPGTPAYKAGVRAGDRILAIGDKQTAEFPENRELETAVKSMKGKVGEIVKVTILHEGETEPKTFDIERAIIKTPTVLGDRYQKGGEWSLFIDDDKKIGYLRLTHFSRNSAEEVEAAIKKLEAAGMRALVLDLRFNPGGLLSAATAISDLFVESGVIVSTKGRNTEEQVVKAKRSGTHTGFPMVVLVNRYSASASEIVSACLQDDQRALIVGERTWGKGSVQNVIELEGGKSAIKLTTASYHRRSGKNIHRFPDSKETDDWGVMPDAGYEVKLSNEELKKYLDYRRDRDVLREDGSVPQTDYVDPQLSKALEWITTKLAENANPEEKKAADAGSPSKTVINQ